MSNETQKLRNTVIYKTLVGHEKPDEVEEKITWGEKAKAEEAKVCLERARLITESYKQTEGEPEVLRRAKALAYILDNMTIYIRDGERIVGNFASDPAGIPIFPELALDWVDKIIMENSNEEERRLWREEICSYWDGKNLHDRVSAVMPDSIKDYAEPGTNDYLCRNLFKRSIMRVTPNWEKILHVGLDKIISEIEEKLSSIQSDLGLHPSIYIDRRNFYEATLLACSAVVRFANRFAILARDMAKGESDDKRAKQLEQIAEICQSVPANPARTLWEAMQSFWFTFLVNRMIETCTVSSSVRLDQLLFPFYQNDVSERKIDREEAQELMELLLVKVDECGHLSPPEVTSSIGATMYITFTLGGVTKEGRDATNDFSFIMLDAAINMKTVHTNYALRYHPKITSDLIDRAIDLLRTGVGYPAFFSDTAAIPMILERGIPPEDARDYAIGACVSWGIPGKNQHNHRGSEGIINLGKCLELALNEGCDMLTGRQTGYATPDPTTFASLDDVKDAFFKQVEFATDKVSKISNLAQEFYARYMQMPFTSAVVDGCVERGQELYGWTYSSRTKILLAGNTNVADSLAAIKKFVFDEKKLTMQQLLNALKSNYDSQEELRQMLIHEAPKFGNDDDYVDNIMEDLQHRLYLTMNQFKNWWGEPWFPDGSLAAGYYTWAKRTAATPDGRKARDTFADGVLSPMAGRDNGGPTAVLKSMSKVSPYWPYLTNQKFLPQFLAGENKKVFSAYLKSWADLGNYHIQFNIVDKETLLNAQATPVKYSNLIVRVAGYSAHFVDLSKGVQDDIIARSAQSF
jgi:pyruvate formate-lyase/glycerol dehydratase family glycyl radical enzyme